MRFSASPTKFAVLGSLLLAATVMASGIQSAQAADPTDIRMIVGEGVKNVDGHDWQTESGFVGGTVATFNSPIDGTGHDVLYQRERYGVTAYNLPVTTPAYYDVVLKEAELWYDAPNKRVFDVLAEGKPVASNVDIFKLAGGKNKAYKIAFKVPVTDGMLNLSFVNHVNVAKIDSLVVTKGASLSKPASTKFGFTIAQNKGESYQNAIKRENALYGGNFDVLRTFDSTIPSSWTKYTQNHKGDVIISFKDAPATILNGSLDARFKAWLNSAPTDRNVYWSYLHEPEDNIEDGQMTAAQYRAVWQHLSTVAKTVAKPNVKSELILMSWTLNPSSGRTWTDYYAGPEYVDVLGWDAYNDCAKAKTNASYCTAQSLDRVVQVSKAQNKPWGIAEYGSMVVPGDDGTKRAAWIKQTSQYLESEGAIHAVYFDYRMASGNDYRLLDKPSQSVFKSLLG